MKLKEVAEIYPELRHYIKQIPFQELFPPQEEAIKKGALENNFLLASGTGSGKSIVAYLSAALFVEHGKKFLYLVPLRALGFEKFKGLKALGLNVALAVGEKSPSREKLLIADGLVATYEKAEALLRNFPEFFSEVGRVIFDEIHEFGRKPLIEVLLAKFRDRYPVLGLSATMQNVEDIAKWLKADFVKSDFRPVPLKRGVITQSRVVFEDGSSENGSFWEYIERKINSGISVLVFTNSRREAMSLAKKAFERLAFSLDASAGEYSEIVINALERPTEQCRLLAKLMQRGIGFHHAGLHTDQRLAVEGAFRERKLQVLFATPTLVAGVNLPAGAVVLYRPNRRIWTNNYILQAFGRAGRAGYDEKGEALLYLSGIDPSKAPEVLKSLQPQPVKSSLADPVVLRKTLLGIISRGGLTREELDSFARKTFFAHETGRIEKILGIFRYWASKLVEWGFAETDGNVIFLTGLGRAVASYLVDPASARLWLMNPPATERDALALVAMAWDYDPFRVKLEAVDAKAEAFIPKALPARNPGSIKLRAANAFIMYEKCFKSIGEDFLAERFGVFPGDLSIATRNFLWLLEAMGGILEAAGLKSRAAKRAYLAVKYSVGYDLIDLVELPFIGEKRAKELISKGITRKKLEEMDLNRLKLLLGPKIGEAVYFFLRKKAM